MSITDADIGQNVQRARYQRGLTQAETARAVGLDRTAISRIEAGTRSLTATELAVFAEALEVAVDELLRPVAAESRSPNLARMLMREGPVTPIDEPQLAWFVELVEGVAAPTPTPPPITVSTRLFAFAAAAAGELGARVARRQLGCGPVAPIRGFSGLLFQSGIVVASARFPSKSRVAGCALTLTAGVAAILVNANHPTMRQRFTLAHELAHLVFDADSPVNACDAGEIRPGPRSRAELRADAFAAAFLLPRRVLMQLVGSSLVLESLRTIEAQYGVSHAAAVHRLREVGGIGEDEARVLRRDGQGSPANRSSPPYRLLGESFAQAVGGVGARRSGDAHGYEVAPDDEVVA